MRRQLLFLMCMLSLNSMLAQIAPSAEQPPLVQQSDLHPVNTASPERQKAKSSVDFFFIARASAGKAKHHLIDNLAPTDCHLDVDGKPQTIQAFSAKIETPMTLGVLVDTSLNQQRILPMVQQATATFLRSELRPIDEAFVISFDVTVDMLADLTGSQKNLKSALDRAEINSSSGNYANGTLPSIGRPRGALLYDAVYLATNENLLHQAGRKALIVLTEGRDDGSREKLRSAIESAQKANASVYVLLISDPGVYGILDESGAGAMRKLAQATGGGVFHIGKDGRKLQAAFAEIQKEFQAQYRMSYVSSSAHPDSDYHPIQITCSQYGKPLHIQARQGYYPESAE